LTILVSVDSECKFVLIHNRLRLGSVDVSLILQHLLIILHSIATDKTLSLAKLLEKIPTEQIPRFRTRPKSNPEKSKNLEPSTPIEEILVKIWTQVLGIAQIGIDDNFFELGGHSLLATQVMSQVRGIFQVELPLRHLFEAPTIGGLAQRIEMAQQTQSGQKILPLVPIARDRKLPLSFAQARLWFLAQLQPERSTYNQTVVIRLVGNLNIKGLEQSLNEIVRRHEVLRTTFAQFDGKPFQVIAPTLNLPLSVVDLRHLPEAERQVALKRLMAEESQHPFDLERGPLLRCRLVCVGEQEYIASFTVHHIVSDGWSMGVLVRELATLYEAFCEGKPSPLPELPIQYADFAVWQRQWLQGEVLEAQLAYWKQKLGGNLPVLQLPTDRPQPKVQTFQDAIEVLVLSKTLSDALKTISAKEGVTLFMTLLAAFQILLHWYTDEDDIVVGTDVANRNRAEVEGLIGFFINQLVLHTYLGGNPTFQKLLTRVKEVTLGAYAHQDMPFDKLVEALKPERDLRRMPLFQVKLILQNTPMPPLELANLTLNILRVEQKMTELDLLLMMQDTEQGLVGTLKYSTDLFDAATITRILEHFETLLGKIATQPEVKLSELKEILVEADKQQQIAKEQAYQNTLQQNLMNIKHRAKSRL
jgi:acyl carrier protein